MADDSRADLERSIVERERVFRLLAAGLAGPGSLSIDLTGQQLRVLMALAQAPGLTGQALGRQLGISAAATSGLVERLVEKGLITRGEDPADRRVRRLHLSAEGAEVLASIDAVGRRFLDLVLPELELDDLRRLDHVFGVLIDVGRRLLDESP